MGYSKQAIIGISWMSAFRVSSRAITFLRVIILARLLTPIQFGVFGIASLILALLEVITETGINVFFIQEKKDLKEYINEAWFISIVRGIFISIVIILLSPLIVRFFGTPDAYNALLLISLVPFIRGFINPSEVKYQKELEFNKEFIFRLTIFLFDACIAVVAALLTRSAISLVFGLLAGALLEVVLSFVIFRPIPRFTYQIHKIKKIIQRGKWVTLYVIFNYFAQEGDNIVVGRMLGAGPLGVYQMGYKLSTLPISEIGDVVNKVIFPVYARIAEDRQRLFRAVQKTTFIIAFASTVLGLLLFLLPREVFVFILGTQWEGVVDIVRVLAIYGVLRSITSVLSTLFLALGKQNYIAWMTFVRLLTLFVTIIPLVSHFGLVGASYAALFSILVELPLIVYFLNKVIFEKNI